MDISKLKVAELRAELSDRGLDTKGVKAILVQRLLKAIEEETGEEQEQHTVLDTSTEEVSDTDRRDSKDSEEPDEDPLLQENRESSPETETASAAPSVAVEPPTSEKDFSEVDEADGSPQNAEESSSSNEPTYQQDDSQEFQQDNASSDVRAEYQIEDSTNTNDYQQSDSNVSSDFAKDKPAVYQENNSVEFQQGDNANQQWTNEQDEAASATEPMETETSTHNGHAVDETNENKAQDSEMETPAALATNDTDVVDEEEGGRKDRKRKDRKNRWGPEDKESDEVTSDNKRRKTGGESESDSRQEKHDRSREKEPEPEVKKPPPQVEKPENEPTIDSEAFTLGWYDSDLNLTIDQDSFTYGSPMSDQGFVYMWAGARATYGFNKGKIYYEVNLKEYCDTSNYEADVFPHQLRMGFSPKTSSLQLGESENSYAWETTGQLVSNNKYTLFGKPANVEDSVGVLVDCDSDPENILVRFTLNGEVLKLVRRVAKEPEEENSEYEDVEEQVTDNEADEEKENKEEEEEEAEEKMEGVEEDEDKKKGEEEKEKPAPEKKVKEKKFKTVVTKRKLPKKVKPIEYDYLPEEEGDDIAFRIPKADFGEDYLFPHLLTKNIKYEVNFGQKEEPWFEAPEGEGYVFPSQIPLEDRQIGHVRPEKRADCEMLMMCGLPGAGKTHWVREHIKNNPEKLYNVFGVFSLTGKMKINGEPLRQHIKGKWVQVVDKITKCLNRLLDLGFSRRRNYILDQTNVYVSAQKRKMRSYFGFQRRAMLVVPPKEEYTRRLEQHREKEGQDDVPPDQVILEMKANFRLPEVGELFEEVIFVELQLEDVKKIIEEFNKEGKAAGFGQVREQVRRDQHRRRDSRERDYGPPRRGGMMGGPPFRGGFGRGGGRMERMDRPPMGGMGWGGPPRDRRGGMGGRGGGRWGGDRDEGRGPRGGGFGGRGGFNRGPPRDISEEGGDAPPRREGGWRGSEDRRGGRGGRDDRSGGGRGGWGGRPSGSWGEKPAGSWGEKPAGAGSWGEKPAAAGSWGEKPAGSWSEKAASSWGEKPAGSWSEKPASSWGEKPAGGGFRGNRFGGRGGFGSNDSRVDRGEKSGGKGYQQGGWGSQNQVQHQGWGNQGWGQQGQGQQNWNQWNQQNWNQWNQWNQQQWAGYNNQQQHQGSQQANQQSSGSHQSNSSAHQSSSSAVANTGTSNSSQSASSQASSQSQQQTSGYGATAAATASTGSAAATQQGYNAAGYGTQAATGYGNTAATNYSNWTAAQYQQYYAAQGWTQNADGSYNYPQNWNAQNWQQGYGYSTTGQTGGAGQTSQSASK